VENRLRRKIKYGRGSAVAAYGTPEGAVAIASLAKMLPGEKCKFAAWLPFGLTDLSHGPLNDALHCSERPAMQLLRHDINPRTLDSPFNSRICYCGYIWFAVNRSR